MGNRVRLRLMGLSYNQLQSGAYALILAQIGGPYRIPVVIGPAEAQSIAAKIEGITLPKPFTHDLFVSLAQGFGVRLKEIFIYRFEDGIFSSELTFTDGTREIVLDARTSDAIAISVRTGCPIYTTPEILSETGFIFEDSHTSPTGDNDSAGEKLNEEIDTFRVPRLEQYTLEELEKTLQELIGEEKYEEAAKVTAIIRQKKQKRE